MIEYLCEDIDLPELNFDEIDRWIAKVVASYGFEVGELCYIFCSDDYILSVNNEYLQHDYYTDVITFDYCEGGIISGDIFVSLDTVCSNSLKFEQEYFQELKRVVIHGVLHLCGLHDKSEKEAEEMREAENKALELLKH